MTDMAAAGTVDLARIPTGFADPVHDAQAVFRVVLEALSRPGRMQALPGPVHQPLGHPAALKPALAAALLALLDAQTSLWLSPALAAGGEVQAWLRFHTGTRFADRPDPDKERLLDTLATIQLPDVPKWIRKDET